MGPELHGTVEQREGVSTCGRGTPARMEGCSQGFCDSAFRSRGDQTRPGYPLLFLMPVLVLVVEGVLLLLVIGCLVAGGLEVGFKPLGQSCESLEPCFQSQGDSVEFPPP